MKHTFEHGQVPVICDLEKAKQTKIEIDANTEKKINKLREKFIKANYTNKVSLLLLVLFLILTCCSNKEWLTLIMALLAVLFGFVCIKTLYGTKNPDKSIQYVHAIKEIKDEMLYPMSVQFFMLQNKAEITKALLTYSKDFGGTQYATLSLYWINEDDVVEKQDFEDLDVKYKKGIIDTKVDLDNECVIRPFVDSTEF